MSRYVFKCQKACEIIKSCADTDIIELFNYLKEVSWGLYFFAPDLLKFSDSLLNTNTRG